MDAYFTGPNQKILKFHAEKTQRIGFFLVHFHTDVVGEWRSMVRFNGVNVQSRSAKLKVVRKKNRFQVSVQNVQRHGIEAELLTLKVTFTNEQSTRTFSFIKLGIGRKREKERRG